MNTHKWSDVNNQYKIDDIKSLIALEQATSRFLEEQDPRVAQCLKEENTGNQHRRRHKVTERILEARVWSVLDRNTGEHEPRTNSETNSSEEKRGD